MSTDTAAAPTARTGRLSERRLVVIAAAVIYLAAAYWFWHHQVLPGDAVSRVANAYYVLYSRDPHLAAIGFVWNPLPSLIFLPFLPLGQIIPGLISNQSPLAPLVSAVMTIATVAVAHDVLRRIGLGRVPRLVLTAALALHPLILIYGGNGMSEALFLFLLMLAVRSMHRWLAENRVEQLVPLGLALALAYGARYEALAPAAAVTVVVAGVTWWRTRQWALARADAVLVGLPPFLAVALWALAGKVIVNQWFATFSSQYGNSTQVKNSATDIASATGGDLGGRTAYWLEQLLGLSPFALVLAVFAMVVCWQRQRLTALAPLAVLGSVLAFDGLAFLSGTSFGWLRFNITVVPLGVLLAGHVAAHLSVHRRQVNVAAALTMAVMAIPATLLVLDRPRLARGETDWATTAGAEGRQRQARFHERVAADLDAMDLPDGAVVTDAQYAFELVLASNHPRQFVITPDRDFPAVVADPAGHRARYLLLSASGVDDAVRTLRFGRDFAAVPTDGVRVWRDAAGAVQWTLVPV